MSFPAVAVSFSSPTQPRPSGTRKMRNSGGEFRHLLLGDSAIGRGQTVEGHSDRQNLRWHCPCFLASGKQNRRWLDRQFRQVHGRSPPGCVAFRSANLPGFAFASGPAKK